MNSDEKPFKVIGPRKVTTTGSVYRLPDSRGPVYTGDICKHMPSVGEYALPEDHIPTISPPTDEYEEAFRTACLGEPNKPPEAAAEKYEPVVVPPGSDIRPYLHADSNADSRLLNRIAGPVIVGGLGAVALLIGIVAYNASNTPRNYETTKKIYSSSAPAQSQLINERPQIELKIDTAAFDEYQRRMEEKCSNFAGSQQVYMKQVDVPEGLTFSANEPGSGAFALDINGDGTEEIYLQDGCGSGGCYGSIYQNNGSSYVKILDTPIDKISDRTVNGQPVVYNVRKHYLPEGSFTDMVLEYSWNGQEFVESDKFIMPESLSYVVENIQSSFSSRNPEKISGFLRELDGSIGTYDALRAFLQFQAPPGFTMPTGSEYVEYVRQYAIELEKNNPGLGERALTRYANDPNGFFKAVYSHSGEQIFLDISNPKSIVAVSLGLTLKRLGKSDFERHMDLWNRAQNNSGFIAAYRNATGRYPQTEEELWGAQNNVVREDKLRTHQGSSEEIGHTRTNPDGTSQYRGDIYPGATSEQIRSIQAQQQRQAIEQRGQENVNQFRQDVGRGVQQGAERSRQMINQGADAAKKTLENIFKAPPKKPPGK
ncbi:MAG: hypothetical protein AABX14_02755 [Candidatus Aenigmatarchaeota archaeon]